MKRLFIVGGMRCATSSLASYLRQHPSVFDFENKEPNYLIFHDSDRSYIRPNGVRVFDTLNNKTLEDYEKNYSEATEDQYIIDASTAYISYPHVADTIKHLYPDAKLIVVVRDPIERAISAFRFNTARGTETRQPFSSALEEELANGIRNPYFAPWSYIHCSRLEENLAHYTKRFDPSQILRLEFPEVQNNMAATMKKIESFLDLDHLDYDTAYVVNASKAPNKLSRAFIILTIKYRKPARIAKRVVRFFVPSFKSENLLRGLERLPLTKSSNDAIVDSKAMKILSHQFPTQE